MLGEGRGPGHGNMSNYECGLIRVMQGVSRGAGYRGGVEEGERYYFRC